MKPLYKRILLKLSGEGLMGSKSFGVDYGVVTSLANQIKIVHSLGVEVCVVVGGGNIFRGAKEASQGMDRSVADQVGMLATVMNALYLQDALKKTGVDAVVMSGLAVPQVCEPYIYRNAIANIEEKKVIIFAAGTGSPYFTTDTGAALRASEMKCDAILKSTQVDGVYDSDPKKNANAKRYDEVTYDEVLEKNLKVMDLTAITLAKDNGIEIMVFSQSGENALVDAVCAKGLFTIIKK